MSEDLNQPPDPPAGKYEYLQAGDYEYVVVKKTRRRRWQSVIKWTFRGILLGGIVTAIYAVPTVVDRFQEAREGAH
jgi:hypothetical protein